MTKLKLISLLMLLAFSTSIAAKPALWMEMGDVNKVKEKNFTFVHKENGEKVKLSPALSGNITGLVSDNASALEYAEAARRDHKTGQILNGVGVGFILVGSLVTVGSVFVPVDSPEDLGTFLGVLGAGVALEITGAVLSGMGAKKMVSSRRNVMNAINIYNGVYTPKVSYYYPATGDVSGKSLETGKQFNIALGSTSF